jgi:hypothetical protein
MELKEPPKLDQGGTISKLSRPACTLKKKFMKERQKPQGRKAFRTEKQVKYHNWFTPFLFKQIENARIMAGGPKWSTRAIERELKKKEILSSLRISAIQPLMSGLIAHRINQSGRTKL